MAIEIEEPTLFENILHYGLFVGAIFQMICIMAVIFIPKSDSEQVNGKNAAKCWVRLPYLPVHPSLLSRDTEEEYKQSSNSASSTQSTRPKNKKEKKKNR